MKTHHLNRLAFGILALMLLVGLLAGAPRVAGQTLQPEASTSIFLPRMMRATCDTEFLPRLNMPRFNGDILSEQAAIAWFGKVTSAQNYVDIRAGYNATEVYIHLAVFDRYLWFNEHPTIQTLTEWDAVTLYLDTAGGHSLSSASWKFVAQLSRDPGA